MKTWILLLGCLVLFFMASPPSVLAKTIAIIPIEDMSQGQNGVNEELTEYLAWYLGTKKGFDVVSKESVIEFLARNRVRWLGFVDSKDIGLARDELGADLVVYGTVTLRDVDTAPSLGLTLNLIRTDDGRTMWSNTGGLCKDDLISFLGLGNIDNVDEYIPKLAQNVLESWPKEFEYVVQEQPEIDVERVVIGPNYLKSGEEIKCEVRLSNRWPTEAQPRIFFKAGGRVYLAKPLSDDGMNYEGAWLVAGKDGRYPVTMVINWPSGGKKVTFLGAYNIDNDPPALSLELKGIKLEGTVAFRDQVIITPKMTNREPVSRWKLVVEDENGEEKMSYGGYGNMPPRFVWNGRDKGGWAVEEGLYNVALQVWDRADNMALSTHQVAVARTPPAMVLEAKNKGRDMIVDLSHEGKVPIAFWRMEMRSPDGELIKVAEGDELPMRMDLPMSENDETRKVECTITIKDVLGNQTKEHIDDLNILASRKDVEIKKEESPSTTWSAEF